MFQDNYRCRKCGYTTYIRQDLQFLELPKCPLDGSKLVPIEGRYGAARTPGPTSAASRSQPRTGA